MASPESLVRRLAAETGFDQVGIVGLADLDAAMGERLASFVDAGWHGDMAWLADTAARRRHPQALWPEARSAVLLAMNYGPATDRLAVLQQPERGAIAAYAQGRDYHDVVKGRLKRVAGALQRAIPGSGVKVFVDTAPLMEKPLAAAAGLGWQGRHTNLVSRRFGSWLLLGAVLTTAALTPDTPETDHCGSCRRCLDVCPTDALPEPYRLDARRCISYLTIEHKGPIPRALRAPMGNRVFGCDDCLAVCPWNKFATAARETRLEAAVASRDPPLAELIALDDPAFRQRFAGTSIKRTGRDRFMRNVLIAAGNSGLAALLPAVERHLADASPLVRGAAVWAAARLAGPARLGQLATVHRSAEADATVLAEWQAELGA